MHIRRFLFLAVFRLFSYCLYGSCLLPPPEPREIEPLAWNAEYAALQPGTEKALQTGVEQALQPAVPPPSNLAVEPALQPAPYSTAAPASGPVVLPTSGPVPQSTHKQACVTECGQAGTGALSKARLTPTALYSFEGSGSNWVRHLITTTTGILNGVVNGLISVQVKENQARRVIVTKSHRSPKVNHFESISDGATYMQDTRKVIPVHRIVMIIRNPYETLLAHFNLNGDYSSSDPMYKNTAIRPIEDFVNIWPQKACSRINAWQDMYTAWARDKAPTHVIVYHRLQADTAKELRDVLSFLNESSVVPRIHCALQDSEGRLHRKKPDWLALYSVYPKNCTVRINKAINVIQRELEAKTGQSFQDFQAWKR